MTEDRVWVFQTLTRNALRWGRTFIVFVMSALAVLVWMGGQCACDSHARAAPDAAVPATFAVSCETDAGPVTAWCGSAGAVYCSREGAISCQVPDAGVMECCTR